MRGDWMYDWVQVEMEYRAGKASRPRVPHRREAPARSWAALRAALFPGPGSHPVPHPD